MGEFQQNQQSHAAPFGERFTPNGGRHTQKQPKQPRTGGAKEKFPQASREGMCLSCCPKNPTTVILLLVHQHQQGSRLTLNFKLPHAVMTAWRNQVSFPKPKTSLMPPPSISHTRSGHTLARAIQLRASAANEIHPGKTSPEKFSSKFQHTQSRFHRNHKAQKQVFALFCSFPPLSFFSALPQALPAPPTTISALREGNAFHGAAQHHRAQRRAPPGRLWGRKSTSTRLSAGARCTPSQGGHGEETEEPVGEGPGVVRLWRALLTESAGSSIQCAAPSPL